MPPISLLNIQRKIAEREDARKIFILSEGANTEPRFIEKILTNAKYIKNDSLTFKMVSKTENDKGVTDLKGLIELAQLVIKNKSNGFKKKTDKIMLIFDLDVYSSGMKMEQVKALIDHHKDNIIFVFTNPAIELFLLLCYSPDCYEKTIAPNIEKILANEWVTSSDGIRRRFLADLFFKTTGIDSKTASTDFTSFSDHIQDGINQEAMYLSRCLADPKKKLISNFGLVIDAIKADKMDQIEYRII